MLLDACVSAHQHPSPHANLSPFSVPVGRRQGFADVYLFFGMVCFFIYPPVYCVCIFVSLTLQTTLSLPQIHFILLQNLQGKTRLSKWYSPFEPEEQRQLAVTLREHSTPPCRGCMKKNFDFCGQIEVHRLVTKRNKKLSNFVEVWRFFLFVYIILQN